MQTFHALSGTQAHKLREKALNLTDSSVVDTMYLMAFAYRDEDPDTPLYWKDIGDLFWERYNAGHHGADLDKAISSYDQSVKFTLDFDPEQATRIVLLGLALFDRFKRTKELPDIDKACFCFEGFLIVEPAGAHAGLILENLGAAFLQCFERRGDMHGIQRAIIALQQAAEKTPEGHSKRHNRLNNLGCALIQRFESFGDVSDLKTAVDTLREAVELTPEGHTDKVTRLNNLDAALQSQFERLGNVSDLESAIDTLRKAVELTPDGHANKPSWLNSLGSALQRRFERLGDISDIEKAIDTLRKG